MHTEYIPEAQLRRALLRNEAFWRDELDDECPLLWITAPPDRSSGRLPAVRDERHIWTDPEYVVLAAEDQLSRTTFAGDALPVHVPNLGPDQFAAWLGGDLEFHPRDHNTSWVRHFVQDWGEHPEFALDPANPWWRCYLELTRASVEAGRGKWITAYPDLHSGIDALSAMRGPEQLCLDLLLDPSAVHRAMQSMTAIWKQVIDAVDSIVLPAGQGTTNWTGGWSARRFVCIGQNDFTCMMSAKMYRDFCFEDNAACCEYVDYSLYHLDGPQALRHLPTILSYPALDVVQWIPGAGAAPPSAWLDALRTIQAAGKKVQLLLVDVNGVTDPFPEVEILCRELDPRRTFLVADVNSAEEADALLKLARQTCRTRSS